MDFSVFMYKWILTVCWLCISKSTAANVITLQDKQGNPLSSAVISVNYSSQSILPHSEQTAQSVPEMQQKQRQFFPHTLAIASGEAVSFPNNDNTRHHVYSFSSAKVFNLKLYDNQFVPSVTFDTPGVVTLGCNIHDQMKGFIYVSKNADFWVSDAQGKVILPDDIRRFTVWHPNLSVDHNSEIHFNYTADAAPLPSILMLDTVTVAPTKPGRQFGQRSFGQQLKGEAVTGLRLSQD